MTYFGFLILFLGPPLALLSVLLWRRWRQGRLTLPDSLRGAPAGLVILAHVIVAVVYTTPWDNFLVASGVWWYDPDRVAGVLLGWVPLEEYTFFVLQSLLTGLWIVFLAHWLQPAQEVNDRAAGSPQAVVPGRGGGLRRLLVAALGTAWVIAAASLAFRLQAATYLALIAVWAIPPVLIQIIFGGDILWRQRRLVGVTLATATLYLSAADAVAIAAKIWTIDPRQSLSILLFGALPLEELVFFLATNTLLIFGVVLVISRQSQVRAQAWRRAWATRLRG